MGLDRIKDRHVAGAAALAVAALAILCSPSCTQSNDQKTVTLNAGDDAETQARLDAQGDALAAAADKAAKGDTDRGSATASPKSSADTLDAFTAAKMNLEGALKDGDAAKFRNLFVSRLKGSNLVLCGEVNSKNGLGAYTGFSRFIAHPNPDVAPLIESDLEASNGSEGGKLFRGAYQQFCTHIVDRF